MGQKGFLWKRSFEQCIFPRPLFFLFFIMTVLSISPFHFIFFTMASYFSLTLLIEQFFCCCCCCSLYSQKLQLFIYFQSFCFPVEKSHSFHSFLKKWTTHCKRISSTTCLPNHFLSIFFFLIFFYFAFAALSRSTLKPVTPYVPLLLSLTVYNNRRRRSFILSYSDSPHPLIYFLWLDLEQADNESAISLRCWPAFYYYYFNRVFLPPRLHSCSKPAPLRQ